MTEPTSTTPSTLAETDAFISSLNQSELTPAAETPEQLNARKEATIAQAKQGNLTKPVEFDGVETHLDRLLREVHEFNEEMAMKKAESDRYWAAEAAKNPVPYADGNGGIDWRTAQSTSEPRLYGTVEAAEKFVGRTRWAKFTNEQKAKLRTLTESDLRKMDINTYLGKDAGIAGMELIKTDPGRYFALKEYARKKNLLYKS